MGVIIIVVQTTEECMYACVMEDEQEEDGAERRTPQDTRTNGMTRDVDISNTWKKKEINKEEDRQRGAAKGRGGQGEGQGRDETKKTNDGGTGRM